jgi:hypothetical protein
VQREREGRRRAGLVLDKGYECSRYSLATTWAVLIGLQTHRRVEQVIRGRIESFSVFFQPVALSLLFGLPAMTITNADLDARGVLGRFVGGLRERLGNCGSFLERVLVAEEFFVDLSSKKRRASISSNRLPMRFDGSAESARSMPLRDSSDEHSKSLVPIVKDGGYEGSMQGRITSEPWFSWPTTCRSFLRKRFMSCD